MADISMEKGLKELEKSKDPFKDIKNINNIQNALFYASVADAYAIKIIWFSNPNQFEEKLNEFKKAMQSVLKEAGWMFGTETKKAINKVIDWAQVDPTK